MRSSMSVRDPRAIAGVGAFIVLCLCFLASAAVAQQRPVPPLPGAPPGVTGLAPLLAPVTGEKSDGSGVVRPAPSIRWNAPLEPVRFPAGPGPRRITLEEAQQQAAGAANPMARLAALGLEAARQHRLGVQSDFFPKISSTFANLHFNKFMGDVFVVRGPRLGSATFAVPLVFKDETVVAATVTQPITPLFKLRQVLRIARADERIARAKAGLPAAGVAANVEQSYFELLLAQRQLTIAEANVKRLENKFRTVNASFTQAGASSLAAGTGENEPEWVEASKALVIARSKAQEATAALNTLLGWPLNTQIETVVPASFHENISNAEAVDEAMRNNPEIIEAEQTLEKARAASKLSRLDYIPDVAVVGGYIYQNVVPILPNDFSYVGVMVSYNVFDFGKRERTVQERNAQVAMAETALQLSKAKVAASVSKAWFELDRARQLSNLAQRANSISRAVDARYESEEAQAAMARSEAEMLQAELNYRSAYSRLQQLIGTGNPGSTR